MNSRNSILAQLRQNQHAALARASADKIELSRDSDTWSEAQKRERFKAMMLASHAEVHELTSDTWCQALLDIAQQKQLKQWLYSPTTEHGKAFANHLESLPRNGLSLTGFTDNIEQLKAQLFEQIQASLTFARGAIADTGTLVLWPDTHEPRTMSLVPPVHVCLLKASQISTSFAAMIAQEQWATKGLPTNALLISGPSKTADIQQTLAYGAHGPKELIVLLIQDL